MYTCVGLVVEFHSLNKLISDLPRRIPKSGGGGGWKATFCILKTTFFRNFDWVPGGLETKVHRFAHQRWEGVLSLVALGVWRALSAATAYPSAETSLFLGLSAFDLQF